MQKKSSIPLYIGVAIVLVGAALNYGPLKGPPAAEPVQAQACRAEMANRGEKDASLIARCDTENFARAIVKLQVPTVDATKLADTFDDDLDGRVMLLYGIGGLIALAGALYSLFPRNFSFFGRGR